MRAREREREREVFGGQENEGKLKRETLKQSRAGFLFYFFFFNGKGWVEFGYIVFGLNESQWVFS